MKEVGKNTIVILENIRSMENVGSIFRTCDAVGVGEIYLVGTTPAPYDKFERPQGKLIKASLGAEKTVSWEKTDDAPSLIKKLKEEGYYIIAVEQGENSKLYSEVEAKDKTAFVFGSEVEGVSKEVLKLADVLAEIPMKGEKESLNVAVTAGIALYRILEN